MRASSLCTIQKLNQNSTISVSASLTGWDAKKREGVWRALYLDDPHLISVYLRSVEEIRSAYFGLWNPKKYVKKAGKRNTHLLDVMVLQKKGVNFGRGLALKTLTWLKENFPSAYSDNEWKYVLCRCNLDQTRKICAANLACPANLALSCSVDNVPLFRKQFTSPSSIMVSGDDSQSCSRTHHLES